MGHLFKIFIATLLLTGTVVCVSGQSPFVKHYSTFEGLPSNVVYYIYQDSKKFLWFATDAGVSRFDGTHFTHFRKHDGLNSNTIIRIKEDSTGRLWFFNLDATMNYFHDNRIYNSENAPFLGHLVGNQIFCDFYENADNTIFFYSFLIDDIFILDTLDNVTRQNIPVSLVLNPEHKEYPWRILIKHLSGLPGNRLSLWTRHGLYSGSSLSKQFEAIFEMESIRNVYELSGNRYVLDVYEKPLILFNLLEADGTFSIDSIQRQSINYSHQISAIFEDNTGVLWISTFNEGIFCFKNNNLIRHFDIPQGQSVFQDHENNIWISSMSNGAYRISPHVNDFTHFRHSDPNKAAIYVLARHYDQGMWYSDGHNVFLKQGGLQYTLDLNKPPGYIFQMLHFEKDKFIISETGNWNFQLSDMVYNAKTKTITAGRSHRSDISIKRFVQSNDKKQLIGYMATNLFLLDQELSMQGSVLFQVGERIHNAWFDTDDVLHINALNNYLYKDGHLQDCEVHSDFNGKIVTRQVVLNDTSEMYLIDGESILLKYNNTFCDISEKVNLPSGLLFKHMDYSDDRVIMATNNVVYTFKSPMQCLNAEEIEYSAINMAFRNIHDLAIAGEDLYVASDDGLTRMPLSALAKTMTMPPLPYFNYIQVNDGVPRYGKRKIRIRGPHKLYFNFSSINYSDNPTIFSYMLKGADEDWASSSGTEIVYQKLSTGRYEFLLRARKPNSGWSDIISVPIIVKPAIWQHPLFFVILFIAFSSLVYYYFVRHKYNEIKKRELELHMILLEQQALQSMMNPHFIFNSLGSIQNFLLQDKAREAGIYLTRFSRLVRLNLRAISSGMISLNEEIDRLKNYLELEQFRLPGKFTFSISVHECINKDKTLIPSMVIQPVVENAIWHGISPLKHEGKIDISINMQTAATLKVIIEDNGVGFVKKEAYVLQTEHHLQMGMSMTRKRLDILGKKLGVQASVVFEEVSAGQENPGTRVILIIPVEKGERKPAEGATI